MSEPKELDIHVLPEVAEQMADDPELAEALKETFAVFHQAHHAVETGQYKTFDDAMEAITGSRPELVEFDEEPFS